MIFTSGIFLAFFCIVYALYWAIRGVRARIYLLLFASQVFYGWWDWRFLGLMWTSIVICHVSGLRLERSATPKRWVGFAVASMLLILGIFKYYNFFADSAIRVADTLGLSLSSSVVNIVLPVGISFYTFQAISYVVDVYRKEIRAETSIANTAMYISFFPQLVAGPIVRARDFLPQLTTEKRFEQRDFLLGVKLFLIGFIYKALLSDNISPFVDQIYGDIARFDATTVRMATLGFYAQIYFDFAGYSIMAIGIARLFGYRLSKNFDFPYRSTSITEFWRRWHISLSSWLRDYLYIPLGGNRGGAVRTYRNLMITMLLGGLWHGASWNFVAWGGAHGAALALHKRFRAALDRIRSAGWLGSVGLLAAGWLTTQILVYLLWIPFRSQSFHGTWEIMAKVFGLGHVAGVRADIPYALIIIPLWVDTFVVGSSVRMDNFLPVAKKRAVTVAAAMGAVFAVLLYLMPLKVSNFIYFQF